MAEDCPPLPRIYFSSNDRPEIGVYGLWLRKSEEDIAKIPNGPKQGMKVTIYEIGDIEMEAHLEWSEKYKCWTARGIEETIRENHETWD